MNDATLQAFRDIAEQMHGNEPRTWQWIGRWDSQRMFGITEQRAREYAEKFGGTAQVMPPVADCFDRHGHLIRVSIPEGD